MDDVAALAEEVSGEAGGRFGLHPCATGNEDTNPIVLTALEDGAKHSPETVMRNLEDVFRLQYPRLSGNLSVMPGPDAGSRRIGLYLKGADTDISLRLHAEVRSTWINLTCGRYLGPAEKAVALASALVKLATIPGQRTVSINGDEEPLGVPDRLAHYAELLEPLSQQTATEAPLALVRA